MWPPDLQWPLKKNKQTRLDATAATKGLLEGVWKKQRENSANLFPATRSSSGNSLRLPRHSFRRFGGQALLPRLKYLKCVKIVRGIYAGTRCQGPAGPSMKRQQSLHHHFNEFCTCIQVHKIYCIKCIYTWMSTMCVCVLCIHATPSKLPWTWLFFLG